ncbi:MAG: 23S rRNA (adenine(2503)-C(2))-methyltransferase RlmN [Candidatus Kerfeldbacteria bacterium CG15_BIG_FIL_POST_REV_8_21_14_020_45_12]|uniref:23S rRNA (Adenine(2503)-C(2))-methyltransferase RlmN n=1 Tax=Candidatus Kerfeldbacteria bacterium CG15_BIG_FIL_POST_REV_8_21_14_020_45_12 TaxID=2014247 RepID=A0A2M7H2R5_9BACT|nr:MAG: 23S rRNA (adenine(2503)-C(2))-methyltransferase RlmN [Candidatus Kerfeldbacteria bacterium CG15_BIG_FIL_POST_REV_8_21_14_020_45_12]PJA92840.1 MAG: 23S rRNA (adenine(2503)-C(2))-methyltransferase RlmN [Candidatus Kerfeldbacteria bacterium CG_4_9_14_3_um_filter_45_8]
MSQTRLEEISEWLAAHGEPAFRARQLQAAWYSAKDWSEVTVFGKELRDQLAAKFPWIIFPEVKVLTSKKDGSKKALVTLPDDLKTEVVWMPNARDKRTVCVSSQVGCAMACTFCATGTMGLKRNLTVDEIVDQVRYFRFTEAEPISNIVFMGMGEPMANYDAVKTAALTFVNDMEIGPTRITISTVGIPTGLNRFLNDDELPAVRVALSLHAGTDEMRAKLVPMHRGTSIAQLSEWVDAYLEKRGNRRHHLTLEYVMLKGVNDTPEEAAAVAKNFARFGSQVKLNLIPWNPIHAQMDSSSQERLEAFQEITENRGLPTTIRYSKGLDIDAACGQLVVNDAAPAE